MYIIYCNTKYYIIYIVILFSFILFIIIYSYNIIIVYLLEYQQLLYFILNYTKVLQELFNLKKTINHLGLFSVYGKIKPSSTEQDLTWLVAEKALRKIWESLGILVPNRWKNENVPNHQQVTSDNIYLSIDLSIYRSIYLSVYLSMYSINQSKQLLMANGEYSING